MFIVISGSRSAYPEEKLIWPVAAEPALTSSFGEFRPGHFHFGVDLKVYGCIGVPCYAVADGWLARLKLSPTGYGKALYLKLEDGRTTVYAHLDHFTPEVEQIVHEEQYARKNYAVELFFEQENAVLFKKGDVVAFAGRSGTQHPHLHFEIRDAEERPLNVLFHGINVEDKIPPIPVALAVEPLDAWSSVEEDCQPRIFEELVYRNDGVYSPRDPIGASGRIGVSVNAYDKTNQSENLLAVYAIELLVNDDPVWLTQFDRFAFSETNLIVTERNYRLQRRGKGIFHRLFRAAGNNLDVCRGNGIIDMEAFSEFPVDLRLVLSDASGNRSQVVLSLVPDEESDDDRLVTGEPMIPQNGWGNPHSGRLFYSLLDDFIRFSGPPGICGIMLDGGNHLTLTTHTFEGRQMALWKFPCDFAGKLSFSAIDRESQVIETGEINMFQVTPLESSIIVSEDGRVKLELPAGAVFDTMWVYMVPEPAFMIPGEIEAVYRVEPRDQPLAVKVQVGLSALATNDDPAGWGVYYLDQKRGWTYLGSELAEGFINGPALSWETFGLVIDRDNPSVTVNRPADNALLNAGDFRLEAQVSDATSGVVAAGITVAIDAEIVPAEYDSPRRRILYKPWHELTPGDHELKITVSDRIGNTTEQNLKFKIRSE